MTLLGQACCHARAPCVTNCGASAVLQGLRGEKGEAGSPGLPGFSGPKGPTVSVGRIYLKIITHHKYDPSF